MAEATAAAVYFSVRQFRSPLLDGNGIPFPVVSHSCPQTLLSPLEDRNHPA